MIAQEPPTRTSRHIDLSNQLFLAPVGASNHEVIECYTLDKNVLIISLTPHIHLRVNTMQIIADLPDG